ncbi:integrase arm-type DNA-binding domain-containing protein [Pseudomonas sp. CC6-YY-74]|uniref:tyrosine-type recombinase/integrase n=1 Tax=Pseudomonas sp. CC6-YY-74 TaxID=1930532 RepID=UPI0015A74021|nr:integrase arm-type DNA-binding domain-containing protein [Pseudomonas sp. CC6-YY-74]
MRVNKASIAFIYLYSFHGAARRMTLGQYPALSLADARAAAHRAAQLVEQGLDPGQKKVMELFEYRESPSVAEAVQTYIKWAELNKKSWKEDQRQLERELVEPLGRMKIQDVKRKQILALLDEKAKTAPVAANRIQAVIRKLFNFCLEREIISATPLVQMKKIAKEAPRERSLNRHELVWFFHRLVEPTLTIDTRFALLMSLVLAQRSGQVVGMRWVDLDLEEALWDRTGKFEKNNNPVAIPLPRGVIDILEYLRERRLHKLRQGQPEAKSKIRNPGAWVFPGRVAGTHMLQPTLNRGMRRFYDNYVAQEGKVEEEGLLRVAVGYPRPTVHDLRRTATTHMSSRGLGKDVRGRLLNHKDVSVDAIYDRYSYFDEKSRALDDWFEYLMGLFRKEFGDVSWVEFYGSRMEHRELADKMEPS